MPQTLVEIAVTLSYFNDGKNLIILTVTSYCPIPCLTFILKMNHNKSSLLGYTPEMQGNHRIYVEKYNLTITWLLCYIKRLLLTKVFLSYFFW